MVERLCSVTAVVIVYLCLYLCLRTRCNRKTSALHYQLKSTHKENYFTTFVGNDRLLVWSILHSV